MARVRCADGVDGSVEAVEAIGLLTPAVVAELRVGESD